MSPWAAKRLHEFGGDITKFKVEKVNPSILDQIAIAKTEPGDDNNQDISSLVGKVDIRMLEHYAQDDADAYSYSGALCKANQGMMEFVEMFKAPIKVLHPLADRDPGRKLQRHRGALRHSPSTASCLPTPTNPSGSSSATTEQRSLPRPGVHRQGALLPASLGRGEESTRNCCSTAS